MIVYKYESTGNDFILSSERINNMSQFAKDVCDRHFGIGADGLMVVDTSLIADVKMHYYNSDGSVAPMCGNGLRAFSDFVYQQGIVIKNTFTVETLAGIMKVELHDNNHVSLDLGEPIFSLNNEDIREDVKEFTYIKLDISNQEITLYPLMMGTFHGVVFVEDLTKLEVEKLGNLISTNSLFPNHINVNFVQVIDDKTIHLVTYERGAGLTLSCGTGASATAVIANRLGYTKNNVTVHVPGGMLQVEVNQTVTLKGPTRLIGKIEYRSKQ
jgi:diaminopimelate epimerase